MALEPGTFRSNLGFRVVRVVKQAQGKKKIALTGGGTAGHVMPHLALLDSLRREGLQPFYVGSHGIEKELVGNLPDLPFFTIASGKLRRYFSWRNFSDVLKVLWGTLQALVILRRERPAIVFSKGGFVSVPVAVAARALKIPVISHESDVTPGLANRIIARFASKLLYSFPQTSTYLPDSAECVGLPVRPELMQGQRAKGLAFANFPPDARDPVILVMGGSLGAQKINEALEKALPKILERCYVVHITGKGKELAFKHPRYFGVAFVKDELKDLFAATDLVIARSGANSIFEFLALRKPMLLIPLEAGSRGDQIHNAESFAKEGWATVLREKDLSPETLLQALSNLETVAEKQRIAQTSGPSGDAERVMVILRSFLR